MIIQKIKCIVFAFFYVISFATYAASISLPHYYVTSVGAKSMINGSVKINFGENEFTVKTSYSNSSGQMKCMGIADPVHTFIYNSRENVSPWYMVQSTLPLSDTGDGWHRLSDNIDVKLSASGGKQEGKWHFYGPTGWSVAFCGPWTDTGLGVHGPVDMRSATLPPAVDVHFRVKEIPADGTVFIPPGKIGYGSFAYTGTTGPSPSNLNPPESIAIYVDSFVVTFDAVCKWENPDMLVFDYGLVPPGITVTKNLHPVFTCSQDGLVKLILDTTWGSTAAGGVSVDLKNTDNKVTGHSHLRFAEGGREIKIPVQTGVRQNFSIESSIDTTDMPAGPFEGSAVLIAILQ
ncbi:hypothetical protein J9T78_004408 [Salmonella enterica]|nr:hypothetical protein [Salmonella enterica]EHO4426044.1 hypothetical protein [Salmonella enterica]